MEGREEKRKMKGREKKGRKRKIKAKTRKGRKGKQKIRGVVENPWRLYLQAIAV